MDPCGVIIDYARDFYVGKVQPYYDSDEQVPVTWYRAAPGAKVIDFPTCFGNPVFSDLKDVPVGMVWDPDGVQWWFKGNPGAYLGKKVCGTPEAFLRGVSRSQEPIDCTCPREPMIPVQEIPDGVVDGVNRHFILSDTPMNADSLLVMVNGDVQTQDVDYTWSGTNIYFTVPSRPLVGSNLLAYYWVLT